MIQENIIIITPNCEHISFQVFVSKKITDINHENNWTCWIISNHVPQKSIITCEGTVQQDNNEENKDCNNNANGLYIHANILIKENVKNDINKFVDVIDFDTINNVEYKNIAWLKYISKSIWNNCAIEYFNNDKDIAKVNKKILKFIYHINNHSKKNMHIFQNVIKIWK